MDLICGELDRYDIIALNTLIIEPISKSASNVRNITLDCDGKEFLNTSKPNEIDESIKTFLKLCNKNVEWLNIKCHYQLNDNGTDQRINAVVEFLKLYFANKFTITKNNNNQKIFCIT